MKTLHVERNREEKVRMSGLYSVALMAIIVRFVLLLVMRLFIRIIRGWIDNKGSRY